MPVRIQLNGCRKRKRTNPGKRADNYYGSVLAPPNNEPCHNRKAEAATATTTAAFIIMKSNNNIQNTALDTLTLAEELEKARFTLALLKHVTKQGEFEVEFAFVARNRKAADALSAQLKTETNYSVRVDPFVDRTGEYWVEAKTGPMTLSQEVIDQCVIRMVDYAKQHGCIYDGWSTWVAAE